MSNSAPNNQAGDVQDASPTLHEDTSLDQVRDLLFGHQARSFNARLDAVQGQLQQAVGELHDFVHSLLQTQADQLDRRITGEVHDLKRQLDANQQHSEEQQAKLSEELQRVTGELRQRLGSQAESHASSERSLRADSEQQLAAVREHVLERMDALRNQLQGEIAQVSGASVARHTLRDAFRELSARLDGE